MQYDLTDEWNPVNKTNRQKRTRKMQQTDSDQKGGGRGIRGKIKGRIKSGNTYKGPKDMDNRVGIDCGSYRG